MIIINIYNQYRYFCIFGFLFIYVFYPNMALSEEELINKPITDLVAQCKNEGYKSCIRSGIIAFEANRKEEAAKYFSAACESDFIRNCEKSIEQNSLKACISNMTGDCGKLAEYDSFNVLRCEYGFSEGCRATSFSFIEKGDYQNEIKYLDKACYLGSKLSCEELGDTYSTGREGIIMACEMFPDSDACNNNSLAAHVHRDRKIASKYYDLACSNGSAVSCYILFHWYSEGKSVPKSLKRSEKYLQKTCQLHTFNECP